MRKESLCRGCSDQRLLILLHFTLFSEYFSIFESRRRNYDCHLKVLNHGSHMKTTLMASLVLVVIAALAWAQAPAPVPGLPPGTQVERGEAEILKVYAVDDQGTKFRAYGIKYKGKDVIVSDDLAKTDYKVGEKIDYMAMRINNVFQFKVFAFGVLPKKK